MPPRIWPRWLARLNVRKTPVRRAPIRPRLEVLEGRTLPTATLNIDAAGLLTYTGSNVANRLTITRVGANYAFGDTGEKISVTGPGAGGFTGNNSNLVQGPAAGISALVINLGTGNDTLLLGKFDAAIAPLTAAGGGDASDAFQVVAGGAGLSTGGNVAVSGFASGNVNNVVTSTGGSVSLLASTLTLNGAVTAATGVTLTGSQITVSKPVATSNATGSSGGITINATGFLNLNSTLTTGAATRADSAGDETFASGSISLTAGTGIRGRGRAITGNATLTGADMAGADQVSAGSITLNVTGNGDIALGAASALTTGVVTSNGGGTTTGGKINVVRANRVYNGIVGQPLSVLIGAANQTGVLLVNTVGTNAVSGEVQVTSPAALTLGKITTAGGAVRIKTTGAGNHLSATDAITTVNGPVTLQGTGAGANVIVGFDGKIQSGSGNVLIKAAGDITSAANVTTTGQFTATADSDASGQGNYSMFGPTIAAKGITLSGAEINASGILTSTGGVAITAISNVFSAITTGPVTATGTIALKTAGINGSISAGQLTSTAGDVRLTASGNISMNANVAAAGAFTALADSNSDGNGVLGQINGSLTAKGISAQGSHVFLQTLNSTAGASVTAVRPGFGATGVTLNGPITVAGGLTAKATGVLSSIQINGAATAGASVSLSAEGSGSNITIGAPLASTGGDIQLRAGDNVTVNAKVTAAFGFTGAADVDGAGTGAFSQLGGTTITAKGINLSGNVVTASGSLTSSGGVTASAGNLANPSVTLGTVTAATDITATAAGAAADLTTGQLTTTGGQVRLTAGRNITTQANISAPFAFTALADNDADGDGAFLQTTGTIQAKGITISGKTATTFGTLTSSGAVAVLAGNSADAIVNLGSVTAVADIVITAAGAAADLTTGPLITTGGQVRLTASRNVTTQGNVSAPFAFTALADSDANGSGTFNQFNGTTITAKGIAISGNVVSASGGMLTSSAGVSVLTGYSATAPATLGVVNAAGDIVATAAGSQSDVTAGMLTSSGGEVRLTAGRHVTALFNMTAAGAFTALADSNSDGDGTFQHTAGTIQAKGITAQGAFLTVNALNSSAGVSLTTVRPGAAQTFMGLSGPITAAGSMTARAVGQGSTLNVNAAASAVGNLALLAEGYGSNVSALAPLTSTAGEIQLRAGRDVSIGGNVTAAGAFTGAADVDGTGDGSFNQNLGTITAKGIAVSGQTVAASRTLISTGGLTASAGNNDFASVTLGTATSVNDIVASAAGAQANVTATGVLTSSAGEVRLSAGNNVTVQANITAAKAFTVVADSDTEGNGTFAQGAGTIKAAGINAEGAQLSTGILTSTSGVTLTASGQATSAATLSGAVSAVGPVLVTATGPGSFLNVNAPLTSTAGDIQLTAANGINLLANVAANKSFIADADSNEDLFGSFVQGSGKTATASSVSLAGATVELAGVVTSTTSVATAGALALNGAAVTLGAAGQLTLMGDVTVSGTSTVTGAMSLGGFTRTITVQAAGALTVTGAVSGAFGAGLTKEGPGRLLLTGTNIYTGPTTVNAGLFGGTTTPAELIFAGGTFDQGAVVRTLTVAGDVCFSATSGFNAKLTAVGNDRLDATGTVELAGATLTVSGSFTNAPTAGQQFTIVKSASITGTFAGLAEGSTFVVSVSTSGGPVNVTFSITYLNNGGKNVVLTVV